MYYIRAKILPEKDSTEYQWGWASVKMEHSCFPCMVTHVSNAIKFETPEEARNWWNNCKDEIIKYYDNRIDYSTLYIIEVKSVELEKLSK